MAIRKASAYAKKYARPFTRVSRNKSKSYIKTVPMSKIVKFHQGMPKDFHAGKHHFIVRLIAGERAQIRDNAIEACRMWLTKILDEKAPGQYYLAVKIYPHHLLRENKLSAGAGADRLSTGMTHSYGVVIGRAAMVAPGKDIFTVSCVDERVARIARDALSCIKSKVPCTARISFEKLA
ncbi:MAG TPA: 50S ribosomal protein L16 [Candidatus Nanoarchaeia archaeon]|nr:50S ribosomal protein L16 [Candidatus Nanoarchaeia archaeon]